MNVSSNGGLPQAVATLPLDVSTVRVTRHARDRLREHHPHVGVRGALALLARAKDVEPHLIAPILGRSLDGVPDRYLIAADRRGCFVIARSGESARFPWYMPTYLRFDVRQEEEVARLLDSGPDLHPFHSSVIITLGTRSAA